MISLIASILHMVLRNSAVQQFIITFAEKQAAYPNPWLTAVEWLSKLVAEINAIIGAL